MTKWTRLRCIMRLWLAMFFFYFTVKLLERRYNSPRMLRALEAVFAEIDAEANRLGFRVPT